MNNFKVITKRNIKMFFKDKGLFFTSLITPLILLVLYATFLSNVYIDSFEAILSAFKVEVDKQTLNGLAGGQLMSSLLSVSCVTVSFCSNMLMVQDKVSGARTDMLITPVKRRTLALSYYISTTISTLIICIFALFASLVYVAIVGWYMSFTDVLLIFVDVLMLTTFGTALSSVINFFLSTQGQISAVGSIVSSCYGFISGAYMPLSNLSAGLRSVLMFLPGTYGTSLVRNHALNGALEKLGGKNIPEQAITEIRKMTDCSLSFFGNDVEQWVMYLVMIASIILLLAIYILLNNLVKGKKK